MSSPVLNIDKSHVLISPLDERNVIKDEETQLEHSDGDTASQRSISLSSPTDTRPTSMHLDNPTNIHETEAAITPVTLIRQGLLNSNRDSHPYTLDTDFSSDHDVDDRSSFMRRLEETESPLSSLAPSLNESEDKEEKNELNSALSQPHFEALNVSKIPGSMVAPTDDGMPVTPPTASYPPQPIQKPDSRASVASFASSSTTYSKKARPESILVDHNSPIVLGIALVDFNHLVSSCYHDPTRQRLNEEYLGWSQNRIFAGKHPRR
jgi:hypothetical protein